MPIICTDLDSLHPLSLLPSRRSYLNDNLFSSILGSGLRELQQLERELGQLLPSEGDKDAFNFRCDVAGYNPEELKVELEDNELVLKGEQKESDKDQSVYRTFERRVYIPDNINRETFKCDFDNKGRLHVTAQRKDVPVEKKQSIPINIKQSKPIKSSTESNKVQASLDSKKN